MTTIAATAVLSSVAVEAVAQQAQAQTHVAMVGARTRLAAAVTAGDRDCMVDGGHVAWRT